jgi:CDP-paratose 2-epimerase
VSGLGQLGKRRTTARSLRQLTAWCDIRFGPHPVASDPRPRPFDLPWVILDSALAERTWNWKPATSVETILKEIALHAEAHLNWLEISEPVRMAVKLKSLSSEGSRF